MSAVTRLDGHGFRGAIGWGYNLLWLLAAFIFIS
jgi:hypothetical protein